MKKIFMLALALLYVGHSFSTPGDDYKGRLVKIKQEERLKALKDPQHEMNRFHKKMIFHWVITGVVEPTASITTSQDTLENQIAAIQQRKTSLFPLEKTSALSKEEIRNLTIYMAAAATLPLFLSAHPSLLRPLEVISYYKKNTNPIDLIQEIEPLISDF